MVSLLSGDESVCLILKGFRLNPKRVIGTTCFRCRPLPLRLLFVEFLLLFRDIHPPSGRNHHALVDVQQLALMATLFVDLCKLRQNQRSTG